MKQEVDKVKMLLLQDWDKIRLPIKKFLEENNISIPLIPKEAESKE